MTTPNKMTNNRDIEINYEKEDEDDDDYSRI